MIKIIVCSADGTATAATVANTAEKRMATADFFMPFF